MTSEKQALQIAKEYVKLQKFLPRKFLPFYSYQNDIVKMKFLEAFLSVWYDWYISFDDKIHTLHPKRVLLTEQYDDHTPFFFYADNLLNGRACVSGCKAHLVGGWDGEGRG